MQTFRGNLGVKMDSVNGAINRSKNREIDSCVKIVGLASWTLTRPIARARSRIERQVDRTIEDVKREFLLPLIPMAGVEFIAETRMSEETRPGAIGGAVDYLIRIFLYIASDRVRRWTDIILQFPAGSKT